MPLYEYKGVDTAGKTSKGAIEAESSRSARSRLKSRGVYATEIKEKGTSSSKTAVPGERVRAVRGVKLSNLTMMIRQLSTLVKARIPLDEALGALVEQTDDGSLKSILSQIRTSVNEGKSLAES